LWTSASGAAAGESRVRFAIRDAKGVPLLVSVVLPCLDEVASVADAVRDAREGLRLAGLRGEIIVVDNGSMDGSHAMAAQAGAIVLSEPRRGYGLAIRCGLHDAIGDVIVLADADRSYDLRELGRLVERVTAGADVVVGTRFGGGLDEDAMPWLHRRVGTPALNLLLAVATGRRFRDSQSGFRAVRRERVVALACTGEGMEFASEMLVLAHRADLRIEEIPVRYQRRIGSSKLRPLGDGLRHCRLLVRMTREHHQATRRTRYSSSS
jgi:glycosyltransferase involved in cell wall biosynthesis